MKVSTSPISTSGLPSGAGEPVLLIHGFASNHFTNWVAPGWVKTLNDAGYRAIAFDNRGHGRSSKSYDPADYHPDRMAGDAAALLGHLGIGQRACLRLFDGRPHHRLPGARPSRSSSRR